MKKRLLTLALTMLASIGMASCNNTSKADPSGDSIATEEVKNAIADAQNLSRSELMKKAVAELKAAGAGAKIKIEAVTSRGGKDAAKAEFVRQLKEAGGEYEYAADATDSTIAKLAPVQYDSTVDGKIYTILSGEIEANVSDGYDGAILQDGYQLQKKFIDTGYFTNYIPKEWADDASTIKTGNEDPFTLQYQFKAWMANNKNGDTVLDNVWDVTADKYKGKIQTMDPSNENVNMDWLIMLTEENQAKALKTAFEASTNDNKDLDLSPYAQYGETLKYSYAFIAKFIENAVFNADDGKAINALAKTPGNIGWIVYSKIQNIKESAEITKKDIVISALGDKNTDGTTLGKSNMDGFGGFMYKHYMSIMPRTKLPYTTCAFFNVLSTTAAGYKNWATDVGDYPTMASINSDRSKNGHGTLDAEYKWVQDSTKDNVFPCLNDTSATWWNDTAGSVVETPSYIGKMYNRVAGFIQTCIANKK